MRKEIRFLQENDEIEIYQTAFNDGDLLNRAKFGKSLSQIVERLSDPVVIALDGPWGTGKSYFLKRWVGAHSLQNSGTATTVYFDAFENDILDDPLIGLISALNDRLPPHERPKTSTAQKIIAKLYKPTARIALSAMTAGLSEVLPDIGDAIVSTTSNEIEKSLETLWQSAHAKRHAIAEIRQQMEMLACSDQSSENSIGKLVFVIDELDRCRPDFALQVLETIKHFFSVKNVHFILGINQKMLEMIVSHRYGQSVDARNYLKKFVSFSVTLPDYSGDPASTPNIISYATHFARKLQISNQMTDSLLYHLRLVARNHAVTLRDTKQILLALCLLPDEAHKDNVYVGYLETAITLVVSKIVNKEFYEKLIQRTAQKSDIFFYYGANDANLRLPDLEQRNDKYDRQVAMRCLIWLYLMDPDSVLEYEDPKSIAKLFGSYGFTIEHNSVIRMLHDWLNPLNIDWSTI